MSQADELLDAIELRADLVTRDTIDVNDGIERVMGNRELYARMLRRFRSDYRHSAIPIRSALSDNNPELAQRQAHTLKGAAGMIGAHRLHAHASAVESAIRTESSGLREALASLSTEMDKVLHLLGILLEGRPTPGMPVHLTTGPLLGDAALLERLLELLSKGDGGAVDMLEESGASLRVILGESKLQRVAAAVRQFDFETALAALGEADAGQGI
jgi:HPt (histidine-containing phosphotransfer) domain-containing protein